MTNEFDRGTKDGKFAVIMNPLIIAFSPGASGRFLSAICHMLRHNLNDEFTWTDDNSAHNFNKFDGVYFENVPNNLINDDQFKHTQEMHNYLRLRPQDILPTHAYPNFKLIKEKVPDCKIIIIGHSLHNLNEVIFNRIKKNNQKIIHTKGLEDFFIKKDHMYLNIEIPEIYKKDTMVIMYDEIYQPSNNSFVALDKISSFLNIPINEIVLKNYKLYISGRIDLLRKNNIANI